MDEWEQFRTLLQDRLRERGALARLAKTSGIKSPVIGHWARGETRPSPLNLERLAPAIGVPYEDLMKMAGYLPGQPKTEPNPKLSAFLAWVEMAFHSMTPQEWEIREPVGRALFSVPATDAKTHHRPRATAPRRSVNTQSKPDENGLDDTLQSRWNFPHSLKATPAMAL